MSLLKNKKILGIFAGLIGPMLLGIIVIECCRLFNISISPSFIFDTWFTKIFIILYISFLFLIIIGFR